VIVSGTALRNSAPFLYTLHHHFQWLGWTDWRALPCSGAPAR
jgi:hypothetical protein